jgi:hypothetical protein
MSIRFQHGAKRKEKVAPSYLAARLQAVQRQLRGDEAGHSLSVGGGTRTTAAGERKWGVVTDGQLGVESPAPRCFWGCFWTY